MSQLMITQVGTMNLSFDPQTLHFTVVSQEKTWRWDPQYQPKLVTAQGEIPFAAARSVTHHFWKTGIGEGIRSCYAGFTQDGRDIGLAFETVAWIEYISRDLHMEFIPTCEEGVDVTRICWPGNMLISGGGMASYSLLPMRQGMLLPNDWPTAMKKLDFDGMMCTTAAYMPWFGQVENGAGYIAIVEQPWDAAYAVDHPAGGPTRIHMSWLPSLGKMAYRRTMRYTFLGKCDYNDLAKVYRGYAKETGLFTTLAEKAARNPRVDKLIGSAIVHTGIKTHIDPTTRWYDHEHPERNNVVVPFSQRAREMVKLKDAGIDKLYLHLDGWGEPGYDNQHPDYLPACTEAGGWDGMKELSDTMQSLGYMFGIHDQYRDYYFNAKTFDPDFAMRKVDGTIYDINLWAGGRQSYLCATQAAYYVKRNFTELFRHGIHLEATYLDVFNCNEGDECIHPWHRMTRQESFALRKRCFDLLCSWGIVPSSEEVGDWAMQTQVFAHYGPYDGMMNGPDKPDYGIDVPLYNLVYHDCMIVPWFLDARAPHGVDVLLYALLNGGAAYVNNELSGAELDRAVARYKTVAQLQERIAKCEMVRHSFLDGDPSRQRAEYSDGTVVTIDTKDNTYEITYPAP